MLDALFGACHVRAGSIQRQWRISRTEHKVAAHAGRQIDDDIRIGVTDSLGYLAVEIDAA